MIFIEPLSEKGHQNFNKSFISLFANKHRVIFCADNHHLNNVEKKLTFNSALISKKNPFFYKLRQFLILFKSLFKIRGSRSPYVIFLSYDLVSFSLFSHFLCMIFPNKKFYVVEHNTFVPDDNLKFLFFRFISKKVKHICLAEFIESEISRLGKRALFITHPFGFYDSISNNLEMEYPECSGGFAFMPSSNIDKKISRVVENLVVKSKVNCALLYKGGGDYRKGKLVSQTYFQDYPNLISSASLIIIPQKFEFRVSGVFFESIASSGSIILMSDCAYSRAMSSIFKGSVIMIEDLIGLDDPLSFLLGLEVDFSFRKSVVRQLKERTSDNLRREFYA
ncbi:hypothetical protein CBQ28_22485 [Pseudoalteromonas sp. GCY]|uniref:hypothetical protein n=1 Tax=Pseudoalteromonas sp. GCY TaxID=2003316 RepID=UPI000BFF10D4|nr:hypothetical protein [Pseudoalteromonas sp. GCY]PHI34872.1 hypothetical protein CBQ28_22485 [Pseudoalteromonas sp. GCY]QQQ67756.1 hypothetical protein JJQ94_08065 [Pseudoalteromonas sp. GCY]